MAEINFTGEEEVFLDRLLDSELNTLKSEIQHTDNREFRDRQKK